ncbi:MAG: hypothetical protein ABH863_06150 [Candidatus Micrarchaeota archaeon]
MKRFERVVSRITQKNGEVIGFGYAGFVKDEGALGGRHFVAIRFYPPEFGNINTALRDFNSQIGIRKTPVKTENLDLSETHIIEVPPHLGQSFRDKVESAILGKGLKRLNESEIEIALKENIRKKDEKRPLQPSGSNRPWLDKELDIIRDKDIHLPGDLIVHIETAPDSLTAARRIAALAVRESRFRGPRLYGTDAIVSSLGRHLNKNPTPKGEDHISALRRAKEAILSIDRKMGWGGTIRGFHRIIERIPK